MLVTLIGRNTINKLRLPKEKIGNYWIYDKEHNKRLINIEATSDNNWQIRSSDLCKIIAAKNIVYSNTAIKVVKNGTEVVDKIILKEYSYYYVTIGYSEELYLLYCSPLYDETYTHLHIENTVTVYVGKDKSNQIIFENPLVCDMQAKIFLFQGVWTIENYDKKFNTFVNDKPVSDSTMRLSNGDRISIFGLNIIIINREIYINNPKGKVKYNLQFFSPVLSQNNKFTNTEDEEDFSKYLVKRYFLRTPRIKEQLNHEKIKIISPGIQKENRELPAAVALATSSSMALMTLIMLAQTVSNLMDGTIELSNAIFSFAMYGALLITSVLIPIINRVFSKRLQKANRKDAIDAYKQYILDKEKDVEMILNDNRRILNDLYPADDKCIEIILNQTPRLWERQITEEDFLTIRLGEGDVPSNLDISASDNDSLNAEKETSDLMDECIARAKVLKNGPVLVNLSQFNIFGVMCKNEQLKNKYIRNLLLQLITFQSYDELKLVFLLKDNKDNEWNFAKMLPHIWDNARKVRYFADTPSEVGIISQYVEDIFRRRVNQQEESRSNKTTYADYKPYYLIITDDYKNVEDLNIVKDILKSDQNYGFGLLFASDSILNLPNECKHFVDIDNNRGALLTSDDIKASRIDFNIHLSEIFSFEKISQILSNILIKYSDEKEMMLPTNYTFLEMYNVGNIDQLHISERWRENDSTVSLNAPVGIDGAGKLISLDAHEKFHGPHGLIAGSTGSGKSEFIITYILSLAINYHPNDVQFVLIDYKGGGLAGAFKRPELQLPHLVGTITNIDKSSLQRSLESIESELKSRQVKFSMASIETGESTMDIYKYQRYYHNGVLKEPISHLFIISDEFAELKQQEPEFMDELISIARIGRSLGVHLILATQKPGGVVNDQIRSNAKFGVSLKVQTTSDSRDIIGIPDAAKLTNAGQFFLKVGNDDYLALGQSAWTGAVYIPSNEVRKDYDNSIEFISSTGRILKKVDDIKRVNAESKGEQLTNIVKYISDLAKMKKLKEESLWLPPIPENIYVKEIRNKYKLKVDKSIVNPVIGEYDDPSTQSQNVVQLDLTTGGNVIIYGNAVSGKETLLDTMIYDTITQYHSSEVWIYILDFGGETMKIYKNAAHVGDVIFSFEEEKVDRLFMLLQRKLRERKELLSKYNGSYKLYKKSTKNTIPLLTVIINNYEAFAEAYKDNYNDTLELLLREGLKYRIVFVITTGTTTSVRYRMLQNIKQKIALQMNQEDDYRMIFERLRNKVPANIYGRGLINPEEKKYYEFQTAKISESENWNEDIVQAIEKINKKADVFAEEVPVIPDMVTIDTLKPYVEDVSSIPVGITHKNITPFTFDLTKNFIYPILTSSLDDYSSFITSLIEIIKLIPNTNLTILDAEEIIRDKSKSLKNEYDELFTKLKASNRRKKEQVILIVGLEKFITEMGGDVPFLEALKTSQKLGKFHYIIVETAQKLNRQTGYKWYQSYLTSNTGLWLGNGVNEQFVLKNSITGTRLVNMCGTSYGYAFAKGKPYLIKLLGMKEGSEENE